MEERPEVLRVMEGYSDEDLKKFLEAYDAQGKIEMDEEKKFYLTIYHFLCNTTQFIRFLQKRSK